jgi:hypothetical protein
MKARSPVLLVPALLSSCSPPGIQISVSDSGVRRTVTLSQDWGIIFHDRKAPCVREVIIEPVGLEGPPPAWRIESVGELNCIDLASFVIDEVPAGFTETVALANPLRGSYEIYVRGVGSGSTMTIF